MTKVLSWIFSFGFIFSLISSWLSPKLLSWYASPPVPIGVTCDIAVEWAMSKLIWAQSISGCLGALLGLIVYLTIYRKKKEATSPTPSSV